MGDHCGKRIYEKAIHPHLGHLISALSFLDAIRSFTRTPNPYGDQVVGNVKETSFAPIRDWPLEQPKFIAFPGEPASRKISARSIIVIRCSITERRSCRWAIDHIHHPDQYAG